MVKNTTVKAVYDRFTDTHRFSALKCLWREGDPNMPHIFWDSDVAKWMEGVAYQLKKDPSYPWESVIEEAIDDILSNSANT